MTVWTSPPAASRARVSLIGNVTFLSSRFAEESGIKDCYLAAHRDARWWLPDDPDAAHTVFTNLIIIIFCNNLLLFIYIIYLLIISSIYLLLFIYYYL